MALVLTKEPPGFTPGQLNVVDGGIVIRHTPWFGDPCEALVAFTKDEVFPPPPKLLCPACGRANDIGPHIVKALRDLFAGVHGNGDTP